MGRQHQGMDRPGVRQVPEGGGEQGKRKKLIAKSSVVPQRPWRLRNRWWWYDDDDDDGSVHSAKSGICNGSWRPERLTNDRSFSRDAVASVSETGSTLGTMSAQVQHGLYHLLQHGWNVPSVEWNKAQVYVARIGSTGILTRSAPDIRTKSWISNKLKSSIILTVQIANGIFWHQRHVSFSLKSVKLVVQSSHYCQGFQNTTLVTYSIKTLFLSFRLLFFPSSSSTSSASSFLKERNATFSLLPYDKSVSHLAE